MPLRERPTRRILVVEDDDAIRDGIVDALRYDGFETIEAADFPSAFAATESTAYDLVLLDLVLPGGDGLEVLKRIRALSSTMPVIILTARGDEQDRVRGLRGGADDYVVKPFSTSELLARVDAVLRRSPQRPSDVGCIAVGGVHVDFDRCEVRYDDGDRAELSPKERDLLRYLVRNSGRAIDRDELLVSVWGLEPRGISTRTIDIHVGRLREKLRDHASEPTMILTVRGKGYKFATEPLQQE